MPTRYPANKFYTPPRSNANIFIRAISQVDKHFRKAPKREAHLEIPAQVTELKPLSSGMRALTPTPKHPAMPLKNLVIKHRLFTTKAEKLWKKIAHVQVLSTERVVVPRREPQLAKPKLISSKVASLWKRIRAREHSL